MADIAVRESKGLAVPEEIGTAIAAQEEYLRTILPSDISFEVFRAALMMHLHSVRNIDQADPTSVVSSIIKQAINGFLPGEDAYLVVYRKREKNEAGKWEEKFVAQNIPDYRGLIKVLYRSGHVAKVVANPVYARDRFVADELSEEFHHERALTDRGELLCFYAAVWLKDGTRHVQVMHRDDVEKVMLASPGVEQDPWKKHPVEMGRKTVLKNLCKYLRFPSEQFKRLMADEEAIAALPPSLEQANNAADLLFGQGPLDIPVRQVASVGTPAVPQIDKPPVLGKDAITGATPGQQKYIRGLGERLSWSDPKIDDYIKSIPSQSKASDAIQELIGMLKAREAAKHGEGPVPSPTPAPEPDPIAAPDDDKPESTRLQEFTNELEWIGRWKDWRKPATAFIQNKKWDHNALTEMQQTAVAAAVAGLLPPPWQELFDDRFEFLRVWAEPLGIRAWDAGVWAVDNYSSGNVPRSWEYRPRDLPDDAVDAIIKKLEDTGDDLLDEIATYSCQAQRLNPYKTTVRAEAS